MSFKKGSIETKLKRDLEKNFFFITFKEIQEHPSLVSLKLTEEEILYSREDIRVVINSFNLCGDSKKFCYSIEPHYILKRNQDGKLILVSHVCQKQKNLASISDESLNRKIKELIEDFDYSFTAEEARETVSFLSQNCKELNNIGEKDVSFGNKYCYLKDKIYIPYILHAILTETKFKLVNAEDLLALSNKFFSYRKEDGDEIQSSIDQLIKVPFLAIFNLGLEQGMGKGDYFLDFLPMLLKKRNKKDKSTFIFTKVVWSEIMDNLKGHNYFKNEKVLKNDIKHIKADILNSLAKEMFSQGS